MHIMKMNRRAETTTAAAVPATAAVLREEPLLEMDVVVVLCWVSGDGVKMVVIDIGSKEDVKEVVVRVGQGRVPAGYYYRNTHQRIFFFFFFFFFFFLITTTKNHK